MRRRSLLVGVALAAATGAEPVAARDEAPSPARVVRAFVAAVNQRDPTAPACELLSTRLRGTLGTPGLLGLDTRYPESYSPATTLAACDVVVGAFNGYAEECCSDHWQRTDVGATRIVARRGSALHLRVRVVRRFKERPRARPGRADVFLLREQGSWRIVAPSRLLEFGVAGDQPARLAQLPRYLRQLRLSRAGLRQEARRQVRDYLATRVRPQAEPLPWSGSASAIADPVRDVVDQRGDPVADQQAPDVDLTAVALRAAGGRHSFELRFRGPVPPEASIDVTLLQRRRDRGYVESARWRVTLHDGWASAWDGDAETTIAYCGLRASIAGDTLRFSLPTRQLDAEPRLDRPFRWTVSVSHAAPSDRDPRRDPDRVVWYDEAPPLPDGYVPGAGVLHRP